MIQPKWHILAETTPTSVEDVLDVLLKNRGVEAPFLCYTLKDLEAHLGMCGLDEGARLMSSHLMKGHELILVGDYDCDGITSVAQMSLFLKEIGHKSFNVVIPERTEGYGIPYRAVTDHPNARLLVAMDCGTLDTKSVGAARDSGMDCIVIDHHEVPDKGVAPASVLINPKQPACSSSFKEFCSSGLTLLFLSRLRKALQQEGTFKTPSLGGKYLALATIGTIADIVPLLEGNRMLADLRAYSAYRRNGRH